MIWIPRIKYLFNSFPMKYRYLRRKRRFPGPKTFRNQEGSALSEMAPGLFLLVFFGLFLVVDVIALGFNYCSCVTLNDLQLREAAKLPKSLATDPKGPVINDIPAKWKSTAVGAASGVSSHPSTSVAYTPGPGGVWVTVQTVTSVKPLVTIPVFPGVPGLGAPATLSVTGQKLLENSRSAIQ